MKSLHVGIFSLLTIFSLNAQSLIGAWKAEHKSEEGVALTTIMTFTEGYYSKTTYETTDGAFIKTSGGAWTLENGKLNKTIEFDTDQPDRVLTQTSSDISLKKDMFEVKGSAKKYQRLDDGTPGELNGAWLISGRVVDGKENEINTDRPRKTMKILSGTRFQWIAYNTETKEFFGTGGGTYTTTDGKYTENIEFFSRDNTRVGMSLQFDYERDGDKWYHSGKSSKGDPLNEVWSIRK